MVDSVRTRLTLWYAAVLALSLVVFAFVVYYAAAGIFYERQDESLRSTAQTVASAYAEEFEELHSVERAGEVVLSEISFPNRYVQVLDKDGRALASSRNLAGETVPISANSLDEARKNGISFQRVNSLRVAIVPLAGDRDLGYATVAEPLSVIEEGLQRLRRDFFMGVPIVLLLA